MTPRSSPTASGWRTSWGARPASSVCRAPTRRHDRSARPARLVQDVQRLRRSLADIRRRDRRGFPAGARRWLGNRPHQRDEGQGLSLGFDDAPQDLHATRSFSTMRVEKVASTWSWVHGDSRLVKVRRWAVPSLPPTVGRESMRRIERDSPPELPRLERTGLGRPHSGCPYPGARQPVLKLTGII